MKVNDWLRRLSGDEMLQAAEGPICIGYNNDCQCVNCYNFFNEVPDSAIPIPNTAGVTWMDEAGRHNYCDKNKRRRPMPKHSREVLIEYYSDLESDSYSPPPKFCKTDEFKRSDEPEGDGDREGWSPLV